MELKERVIELDSLLDIRHKFADEQQRLFVQEREKNTQLHKAVKQMIELLQWMDRTGGLGIDVHNRLRDHIDHLKSLRGGGK